jgi:hypothetical protein
MNKKGQRSSKISKKVVIRAIERSIKDQKALLVRAKKLANR